MSLNLAQANELMSQAAGLLLSQLPQDGWASAEVVATYRSDYAVEFTSVLHYAGRPDADFNEFHPGKAALALDQLRDGMVRQSQSKWRSATIRFTSGDAGAQFNFSY